MEVYDLRSQRLHQNSRLSLLSMRSVGREFVVVKCRRSIQHSIDGLTLRRRFELILMPFLIPSMRKILIKYSG
jgi:hypothetical protein